MLTITYGVSGKKLFLLLFAGHIYEKRNFCLLAEEFPFIFLTNWSVVEAMYFRLSIQVLFISKTFQYFHMSIPQASYNIASGSLCPSSVPFIFFIYLFIYFFFCSVYFCWTKSLVGRGCIAVVGRSISVVSLTI